VKQRPFMPDVLQPAPKRGGEGLYKLKTLARLLDMGGEWEDRLGACQDETRVPARAIVCNAVKAIVELIEASNYRVLLPMRLDWRSETGPVGPLERDALPPVNPDLLEIEPGMRAGGFTDTRPRRR
jgi:hypothetical protein